MRENIFSDRFRYVAQLKKMGAEVEVRGRDAMIRGVEAFHPATAEAEDLRGGAALVLAASAVKGEVSVRDIGFIERGYERLPEKLSSVGVDVKRLS